jgi:flagellar assembly protein FliH
MNNSFKPQFNEPQAVIFTKWTQESESFTHETPENIEATQQQILEQLKEEARLQGYNEGLAQAKEAIELQQKALAEMAQNLLKPMQLLDNALIKDVVKTIVWVSTACIGIELSLHPEKLQALLELIKEELPSIKGNKTLHMHPLDVEWICREIPEEAFPGLRTLLVGDTELNRGDFVLNSDYNAIDGTLSTRLGQLFSDFVAKEALLSDAD